MINLLSERHDHTDTKAERIRYAQKWVLSLNAEGKQPPRQLRPDHEEAKRECQRLQDKHSGSNGDSSIHSSTQVNKDVKIQNQQFEGREEL